MAKAAATTRPDGRFTLRGLPDGYGAYFKVRADGRGEAWYDGPADGELVVTHARPGRVTITPRGADPAALKGVNWSLSAAAGGRPESGVRPRRDRHGTFDGTTAATASDVVPGRYQLTFSNTVKSPVAPAAVPPFDVEPGKTTEVAVTLGPAAWVTGKVTDARGKGVPGVPFTVFHRTAEGTHPRWLGQVETAADGTYAAHGPPGWFSLNVGKLPDGFAPPPAGRNRGPVGPTRVEPGRPVTLPDVVLPDGVNFVAKVVRADGTPAAGAEVELPFTDHVRGVKQTVGEDGILTVKNLHRDDSISPRIRAGKAVHVPRLYRLAEADKPVTIELSEATAAAVRGRVADAAGAPVPRAKMQLWHVVAGFGRDASTWSSSVSATATTDKDGRYEFPGLWPGDQYEVKVTAEGFDDAGSGWQKTEPGKVREVPLTLTRANLAVAGVVVDTAGGPVAGAVVHSADGLTVLRTRSADDGSFSLTGFYDAAGFVCADKPGFRPAAVPVHPGERKPVRVVLRRADEPVPAVAAPKDHAAAERAFTRHLLTLVYRSHPQFGYGGNAVAGMALIDPAQARAWVAEERKRSGGKTDWTGLVERAGRGKALEALAAEDVEEAVAALQKVGGEYGFWDTIGLARRLLPTDPAKAARLAEEAAVKARQLDLPRRTWSLAEVGEVAARAGNPAGGRKLIEEAAALAEKLPAGGRDRDTLARGMTAARLAPFDWPRAKAMLDALKDPSEYNRFLAATCSQLAATDLPKAKKLFDEFKPDGTSYPHDARLQVAYRIAAKDPAGAEAIVASVSDASRRFQGYVRLAVLFAPKDRPRAVGLIDRAVAMLGPDADEFRRHSGGAAGYGVLAAVRGHEIGHPDVPGLVARALAARPAGRDGWGSGDRRPRLLVNVAAGLALVDPAVGRQVLAGVAPPDKYAEFAAGKGRDWLFALALCDPERAAKLADALIDRAKAGRTPGNALSHTGLIELISILTAEDRYEALSSYGELPREIREED
jgi:protocatechuate 3,4-dioxygenase beta subunit